MTDDELVGEVKKKQTILNAALLELAKAGINVELYVDNQRAPGWGADRKIIYANRFYRETIIK